MTKVKGERKKEEKQKRRKTFSHRSSQMNTDVTNKKLNAENAEEGLKTIKNYQ